MQVMHEQARQGRWHVNHGLGFQDKMRGVERVVRNILDGEDEILC